MLLMTVIIYESQYPGSKMSVWVEKALLFIIKYNLEKKKTCLCLYLNMWSSQKHKQLLLVSF